MKTIATANRPRPIQTKRRWLGRKDLPQKSNVIVRVNFLYWKSGTQLNPITRRRSPVTVTT